MNIRIDFTLDIWIGLAKVKPLNKERDTLNGSMNAYVNVLGIANNKSRFRQIVKSALNHIDLDLLRIENVEKFSERAKKINIDRDLQKKINELQRGNTRVVFSTFHAYD